MTLSDNEIKALAKQQNEYMRRRFTTKYSAYNYKVAILLVLVLYPFLITPLEYFVFRAITFVIETIVGNVFTRDDHEYVVEHTYLPGFFSY